jgi:hypothetical protein
MLPTSTDKLPKILDRFKVMVKMFANDIDVYMRIVKDNANVPQNIYSDTFNNFVTRTIQL